ncbi:hypothetical protein GX51_02652 [Blastomyces parvus]|uniref:Uncharacterized protein n=1 Tax=Blastomyces parvus TaxID=2060905 RepID=A0A2B7XAS2_9EURO|nr:hypothetical protein GX51_02652 [Blastomyces parvus]
MSELFSLRFFNDDPGIVPGSGSFMLAPEAGHSPLLGVSELTLKAAETGRIISSHGHPWQATKAPAVPAEVLRLDPPRIFATVYPRLFAWLAPALRSENNLVGQEVHRGVVRSRTTCWPWAWGRNVDGQIDMLDPYSARKKPTIPSTFLDDIHAKGL